MRDARHERAGRAHPLVVATDVLSPSDIRLWSLRLRKRGKRIVVE